MSSNSQKSEGFLLLTIKIGEGFWLDETYIGVNKVKSKSEVSLAIKAPSKIKIDRKRKYEKESNKKGCKEASEEKD